VSLFHPTRGAQWFWLGGALGFAFVYGIYLLGALFGFLVSRRRGRPLQEVVFGAGDVKLAAFIGLAVGFPQVVFALVLGILLGGVAALGVLLQQVLVQRRYSAFTAMPYGPFLVVGAWVMLWFGREVMRWYLGL
jgi:leader peptidase (prepilin peptidase)/N-methyltransferase